MGVCLSRRLAAEKPPSGNSPQQLPSAPGPAESLTTSREHHGEPSAHTTPEEEFAPLQAPSYEAQHYGSLTPFEISAISELKHISKLPNIEEAVSAATHFLSLVPSHSQLAPLIQNCLNHLKMRRRLDMQPRQDVDIELFKQLNDNASMLEQRFQRGGEPEDIQQAIAYQNQAVSLLAENDENKPASLSNLGASLVSQFRISGEISKLERAIALHSHANSLLPLDHVNKPRVLASLSTALIFRFEGLGELDDLDQAIICQNQAFLLTHDSNESGATTLGALGYVLLCRYRRLDSILDLNQAINCQTRALQQILETDPYKPGLLSNLGSSLTQRFQRQGRLADLDKAITYHTQAAMLTESSGLSQYTVASFNNLGNALLSRFEYLGEHSDLDKAIMYNQHALGLMPDGDIDKPTCLNNLGNLLLARFDLLKTTHADLGWAVDCHDRAVSLTSDHHGLMSSHLSVLGRSLMIRFEHLGDNSDIQRSIDCHKKAVSLTPEGHADLPGHLSGLGEALACSFKHTGNTDDLGAAIMHLRRAVSISPKEHADRPMWLYSLGESLQLRFQHLENDADFDQSAGAFRETSEAVVGDIALKFKAIRSWARLFYSRHESPPLEVYRLAVTLIPRMVWLGTPIPRRYQSIQAIGDIINEAAAVAISCGEYETAIEWLEEGRSVVWGQISQLRTPLDRLREFDPSLTNQMEQVARGLDQTSVKRHGAVTLDGSAGSEEISQSYRRFAEQWEELLEKVRHNPEFRDFLQPKKFHTLVRAAGEKAVAFINIHRSRCDALLLRPGTIAVDHVPLPDLSDEKATSLHRRLMNLLKSANVHYRTQRQPIFHPEAETEDSFESILATLWTDVVRPVITALGYMEPQIASELPCVTWCTTGPLTFLPLHAAGEYCEGQGRSEAFEYVVSSYTPTLSALLQVPKTPQDFKGLLAVGQAATVGQIPLPGTINELEQIKKFTTGLVFTQLEGDNATVSAVMDAMETHSWVHMACHASQAVSGNPMSSGFYLRDGPLDLEAIAKRSLRHATFAFLSACQTATGDEKLPEEAAHLAAGMISAGYQTVIATMWSINDSDAPVVADKVYAYLLDGNVADSRKAARALHQAVQCLREQVGDRSFTSWVPYIHIGV